MSKTLSIILCIQAIRYHFLVCSAFCSCLIYSLKTMILTILFFSTLLKSLSYTHPEVNTDTRRDRPRQDRCRHRCRRSTEAPETRATEDGTLEGHTAPHTLRCVHECTCTDMHTVTTELHEHVCTQVHIHTRMHIHTHTQVPSAEKKTISPSSHTRRIGVKNLGTPS